VRLALPAARLGHGDHTGTGRDAGPHIRTVTGHPLARSIGALGGWLLCARCSTRPGKEATLAGALFSPERSLSQDASGSRCCQSAATPPATRRRCTHLVTAVLSVRPGLAPGTRSKGADASPLPRLAPPSSPSTSVTLTVLWRELRTGRREAPGQANIGWRRKRRQAPENTARRGCSCGGWVVTGHGRQPGQGWRSWL
jgi:hypothetical protein